ncbi:MAG: hypothetical protein PHV16_00110 [Candidatus Nanoarchaeia archaeon]|nr:hypothetical protein [Candidatus Nanoarchaeia archaeon]
MKKFKKVLREINFTFNNIIMFNVFLISVLIFLSSYIVLSLFNFYKEYALVPALLYFFLFSIKGITEKHLLTVERKYPFLNERLRTARDNIKMENPIVDSLKSDIMNDMKYVNVSSFINEKEISYKILVAVVLCFLLVFTSQFDLSFNLKDTAIDTIDFIYGIGGNNTEGGIQGLQKIAGSGIGESLFDDPSIAQMGDEKLDLIIKPAGYEINLDKVKEPERRDFDQLFPDEVFVESAEVYQENIQKEKQEIVKNYFLKLAEN